MFYTISLVLCVIREVLYQCCCNAYVCIASIVNCTLHCVLYSTASPMLYCTVLYYTVQCSELYITVLYSAASSTAVLYCTVLYSQLCRLTQHMWVWMYHMG